MDCEVEDGDEERGTGATKDEGNETNAEIGECTEEGDGPDQGRDRREDYAPADNKQNVPKYTEAAHSQEFSALFHLNQILDAVVAFVADPDISEVRVRRADAAA